MSLSTSVLGWDARVYEAINGSAPFDGWEILLTGLSGFGDWRVFVPLCVLIGLFAWLGGPKSPRTFVILALALTLSGGCTTVVKRAVDRSRPPAHAEHVCKDMATSTPKHDVILRGNAMCRYSFPSGHTSTATAWLLALALATRRRWAIPIGLGLAIGVGLSRIVIGVHYPLDVTVGALLGIASAATAWGLSSKILQWIESRRGAAE